MQWYLWKHHSIKTVWIMPKKLLHKNKRELHVFTEFEDGDVVIVDGTRKQIEEQISSGAKVFLMGFNRFHLSWKALPKEVMAVHVDEWHLGFKKINSGRTQSLIQFMRNHDRQFIPMTGTLINGELDTVYPAIHIINPNYYASYESFLNQHAIRDLDNKIIGWRNHEKLSKILARHSIRRLFRDVHGDVEVVPIVEVVDMTPKQREMYDKLEKEALLELDKFFIDGTQPGVSFIRARQLMEHPNQFPDLTNPGSFIDILPGDIPEKEGLLDVHLEDHRRTGKPIIIFSMLVPQQKRILQMLKDKGFRAELINGETSLKQGDAIDVAIARGELDAVVASPPSAGVGYNWQWWGKVECDHMVFMNLPYLDGDYLQAIQRAIRGKRHSPLRVSIFEYANSLDQKVAWIVWRKSVEANKVDPTRPVLQLSRYEKEEGLNIAA